MADDKDKNYSDSNDLIDFSTYKKRQSVEERFKPVNKVAGSSDNIFNPNYSAPLPKSKEDRTAWESISAAGAAMPEITKGAGALIGAAAPVSLLRGASYLTGNPTGMAYSTAYAQSVSPDLMDYGREKFEAVAEDADNSGAYWITAIAASALPIAAAALTAPVTLGVGGSIGTAALLSSLAGGAAVTTLGIQAAGSGMNEYRSYQESKGEEVDLNTMLGIGMLYGGAEYAAERIGMGRHLKGITGSVLKKLGDSGFLGSTASRATVEATEQAGLEMYKRFAASNPA
jgi:hypothetical protein